MLKLKLLRTAIHSSSALLAAGSALLLVAPGGHTLATGTPTIAAFSEPPLRAEPTTLGYTDDVVPAFVNANWTGRVRANGGFGFIPRCGCCFPHPGYQFRSETVQVVATLRSDFRPSESRALLRVNDSVREQSNRIWVRVGDSLPPPNDEVSVLSIGADEVKLSVPEGEYREECVLSVATTLRASAPTDSER